MLPSPHRHRRLRSAAAVGTLAALAVSLIGVPAAANAEPAIAESANAGTVLIAEDFSTATTASGPEGWELEHGNTEGMRAGWEGWTFHTTDEVIAEFGSGGDRNGFYRADGKLAVVHADMNRPAGGSTSIRFDSTLWAPEANLEEGTEAIEVSFDSHYKQGQSPQNASLVASFDGADPVQVEAFSSHRLNEAYSRTVDVPAGSETVRIGWEYLNSNNNWFWMIDNVSVTAAEPVDVEPRLVSSAKPTAAPGETIEVSLAGLRAGQQLVAVLGEGEDQVLNIPAAAADGTLTFSVMIPSNQPAGTLSLLMSGEGIVPFELGITVFAAQSDRDGSTTEPQRWFDGFEADESGWEMSGDWQFATREQVVEQYGTDRRHAFTRASGTIAVAEASAQAFDGTITSAPVEVNGGEELELRFDHHYRVRGSQHGEVTAMFDDGEPVTLAEFGDESVESAQARLPLTVPADAQTVRFAFEFVAEMGSGSWMLDDAQLVEPLAPLDNATQPETVIDIFSDVQGANARLQNNVLPGLRALEPQADVIVSNGDLTGNGTHAQYDSYLSAFRAGGGDEYGTSISTSGNHEYYGADGSQVYIDRFLDRTSMRDVGGQGGLWGEVVVDDVLPVLWIGSERYEYPERTGGGPFVEMSDEQFGWLSERLDHYRAANQPVILFSHHVFANSVSGSYINFYKNDFGADQERLERLLAGHPNVTMFSSHTHWSVDLHDWSVEQRFDPTTNLAPTFVNTGAVTTLYGPSGDWGETAVGGADPVGLRAALFEDRLRVTAYEFASGGEARERKHIDIALPAEAATEPVVPAELSVSSPSAVAGEEVTVMGSGFETAETVRLELRSEPVELAEVVTDENGAFSEAVLIPADTVAGDHQLVAVRADGSEVATPLNVVDAADEDADGGEADGGEADGGDTDGGDIDGGNTDAGNTDRGNADGGSVDGAGSADAGTGSETDADATEGLASTGAEGTWIALAAGLLLLAVGAVIGLRRLLFARSERE